MISNVKVLGSGSCLDSNLSMDKQFVIVATFEGIALHDAKTFEKIKHIRVDVTPQKVVLSPNNRRVAYTTSDRQGEIFLLDIESNGTKKLSVENIDLPESDFLLPDAYSDWSSLRWVNRVTTIAFSPDGNLLATGSHNSIRNTDLVGLKTTVQTRDVVKSNTPTVVVWDLASGKAKHILNTQFGVKGIVVSPDSSHLASWSSAGSPKLWDLRNGKLVCEINHVDFNIREVLFSPDSLYVGSIGAMYLVIYDVQSGTPVAKFMNGPSSEPVWLVGAPDTIIENRTIRKQLPGYTPQIFSLAISPDNKYLAAAGDQPYVNIWDIQSGYIASTIEITFQDDYSPIKFIGLDFSPDGKKLMTIHSSAILVWDLSTGTQLAKYSGVIDGCGRFSPDGSCMAIGGENYELSLFQINGDSISDTPSWKEDAFSEGATKIAHEKKYNIRFSFDSKSIVTGGDDGNIQVWDVRTGKLIFKESMRRTAGTDAGAHFEKIYDLSFLSGDSNIIFKTPGKLFLLNCKTWTKREIILKKRTFFFNDQFVVTPDGHQVIGSDLNIYSTKEFEIINKLQGDEYRMAGLAISKDGKLVAAGGEYGRIHVWEI